MVAHSLKVLMFALCQSYAQAQSVSGQVVLFEGAHDMPMVDLSPRAQETGQDAKASLKDEFEAQDNAITALDIKDEIELLQHGIAALDEEAADQGSLRSALRDSGVVVTDQVDKEFLLEVEAALGTQLVDRSGDRMDDIMRGLRPMFESLEKNVYDKLGHTAVRYTLHRLFVARHGWLMKGLDPAGQLFNSSSPVDVLRGKAPDHLVIMFEERLDDHGFGLQELAVFASVLETLIHMEAAGRLEDLFFKLELPLDSEIGVEQIDEMLDLYMTAYMLGMEINQTPVETLMKTLKAMPGVYSYWSQSQKWFREVRKEILGPDEQNSQHSLAKISDVLVQIGERFGQWQDADCQGMKKRLIDLEVGEKGCVPLSSFYKGAVTSGGKEWQFGESVDYMKESGLIDTSDPENPKVMLANYLYSPANCVASSSYYAVCCIDQCESLIGHIERQVRGTTPSPHELAALVAALPSNTVPANRTLSASQLHRLSRIAEVHGGNVPIHGRLFMQWMHMVYPRECAYPHVSGATKPLAPEKWAAINHKDPSATLKEMRTFVNVPVFGNQTATKQGQCGRWVDEEEIFVGEATARRLSMHELESDMNTWVASSGVFLLCCAAMATVATLKCVNGLKGARKQDAQREPRLVLV